MLALTAFAQQADTVRSRYWPTGIRFGTDAFALARGFADESFQGWEVNADVDFYRYYLAVDYGSWARTLQSDSGDYSNDGNYWRAGIDVNFLLKDPDRNMFFLGARFGHSVFSEQLDVITVDPVWGTQEGTYTNTNVKAHWLELTTGIRVKMWKMIWMGYTIRYKFGLNHDATQAMEPHDVPGYGRTDKDAYWGFNYQIFIRLPFRKGESVALKK